MTTEPDFDIDVEQRDGVVIVRPKGELDLATTPMLDDVLGDLSRRGASAVLDLSELSFIDSSGLHTILSAYAQSQRDGLGLTMLPGPPPVMQVFEIAGVLDHLPFRQG